MKKIKLILILFIGILLTNCTYQKVNDNTTVPLGVSNQLQNADTIQVIKIELENQAHYYFSTEGQLLQKYKVDSADMSISVVLFMGLIAIVFIVGLIIGVSDN